MDVIPEHHILLLGAIAIGGMLSPRLGFAVLAFGVVVMAVKLAL